MAARQLVLIRHSKAADGDIDVARPLAPRGKKDAAAIGRLLKSLGIAADRVVVSPAVRARQTWDAAQAQAGGKPEVVSDDRVYANTVAHLLVMIRQTPEEVERLVVVGHNPSMGGLASDLDDGTGDESARAALAKSFPTSGVCVFDIPSGWQTLEAATVSHFSAPRARPREAS
jgi:phosphohistidine phosphatase